MVSLEKDDTKDMELSQLNLEQTKRVPKCSGCRLPVNSHAFGAVGPYCQGPNLSKLTDVKKKTTGLLGAEAAVKSNEKMVNPESDDNDPVDNSDDNEILELQKC